MLTFKHNDTEYEFDQNKLALAEAIIIQEETTLTIAQFNDGLQQLDARALKAMVFLAKRRSGQAVRMRDVDFDCVALINSIKYERPPGAETDPPSGQPTPTGSDNGIAPASAEIPTSEPSPTTLVSAP